MIIIYVSSSGTARWHSELLKLYVDLVSVAGVLPWVGEPQKGGSHPQRSAGKRGAAAAPAHPVCSHSRRAPVPRSATIRTADCRGDPRAELVQQTALHGSSNQDAAQGLPRSLMSRMPDVTPPQHAIESQAGGYSGRDWTSRQCCLV